MKKIIFALLLVPVLFSASFAANAPLNMTSVEGGTLPFPFKVWIAPAAQGGAMSGGSYLYITVNLPAKDFQVGLASPSTEPVLRTTITE